MVLHVLQVGALRQLAKPAEVRPFKCAAPSETGLACAHPTPLLVGTGPRLDPAAVEAWGFIGRRAGLRPSSDATVDRRNTSYYTHGVHEQPTFDGVPLADLVFIAIDWEAQREHVEARGARKGTDEFEPKVEWATEACQDPSRLVGRTASAVYVIGYSPSCGRVLRVVLQPSGHASDGDWIGLTAHVANKRSLRLYSEEGP